MKGYKNIRGKKEIQAEKKAFAMANMQAKRKELLDDLAHRQLRYLRETRTGMSPTEDIEALDRYAQELADISKQAGYPYKVNWPKTDR